MRGIALVLAFAAALASSGCTEVVAATSTPACGRSLAEVKRTYAALEDADVVRSAMGMAASMDSMQSVEEWDSPRGRRQQREIERVSREHARNLQVLERAASAYTNATEAGCWFVPPMPVGNASIFSILS